MKRIFVAALCLWSLLALTAAAQGISYAQASSDRYTVYSEVGQEHADLLAKKLTGLFALYNSYFRFDPASLKSALMVRAFKTKASFDAYLTKVVQQTKDDFVYLHYPTPERSELVIFEKESADDFSASLAHQSFVQFIKMFIPNPPMWLREGFAIFFEQARWDAKNLTIQFQENTAWLETIKTLKAQGKLFDFESMLTMTAEDAKTNLDVFYPESWMFVSFLVNSQEKAYNRFLWDAINGLKRDASFEDNQAAMLAIFKAWYAKDTANAALNAFIDGQKTFPELVNTGVQLYGDKKYADAEAMFNKALEKNDQSYVPYYYLGLIAYAKNDYALADYYYKSALQLGCDPAVTNYALGINAYASNRFDDAKTYLAAAKQAAPDRYTAKVDELLKKMTQ